jgi:hypothetical protein
MTRSLINYKLCLNNHVVCHILTNCYIAINFIHKYNAIYELMTNCKTLSKIEVKL